VLVSCSLHEPSRRSSNSGEEERQSHNALPP
jgi:hypothetical protein